MTMTKTLPENAKVVTTTMMGLTALIHLVRNDSTREVEVIHHSNAGAKTLHREPWGLGAGQTYVKAMSAAIIWKNGWVRRQRLQDGVETLSNAAEAVSNNMDANDRAAKDAVAIMLATAQDLLNEVTR